MYFANTTYEKKLFSTFSTAVTNLLLPQIADSSKEREKNCIWLDQLKSSHATLEHDIHWHNKNTFKIKQDWFKSVLLTLLISHIPITYL